MSSIHRASGDAASGLPLAQPAIYVVATTVAATSDAITAASAFAKSTDARIHVIAARPMPPEWSLHQQSAPVEAFARQIKQSVDGEEVRIDVFPCVCRRLIDVTQLLPRNGIVVIAGPSHRWWPTREQRLAHDLTGLGHRVMFVHTAGETPAELAG